MSTAITSVVSARWHVNTTSRSGSRPAPTPHIETQLTGCDALILECNHDADMLAEGPYSESLKKRVGGPLGHLNNDAAAALLAVLDTGRMQPIVAGHPGEKKKTHWAGSPA